MSANPLMSTGQQSKSYSITTLCARLSRLSRVPEDIDQKKTKKIEIILKAISQEDQGVDRVSFNLSQFITIPSEDAQLLDEES